MECFTCPYLQLLLATLNMPILFIKSPRHQAYVQHSEITVIPSTKQDEFGGKNNLEITELYTKQLEGIKLFSILFPAKALQCGFDSGQDLGINLRELHLLLLSSLNPDEISSKVIRPWWHHCVRKYIALLKLILPRDGIRPCFLASFIFPSQWSVSMNNMRNEGFLMIILELHMV
ncbi:hypothetical protein CFP56_036662 [Quercus suber]|uniref:Uncharacterized protein n=1 Tax=Quercus suber TaxID=58331 RepID=A0AAW0MAL4_QUESU